jgi:syntaxin 16
LLHSGEDVDLDSGPVGLTPKWMNMVDEVHEDVGVIKRKMSELSQKHADHIQVRFGTAGDDEQQIEALTAAITKLYQKARMKVEKIGKGEVLSKDEDTMKKNIQRALASDLQDLSGEFRQSQESYLQALQARKERSQRKLGGSSLPEESIQLPDTGLGGGEFSQMALDLGGYDEAVER